jgi:hypothetical protein
MSAQRLVTLTGPSPATFATENNTTKSVPPNEKNQALDAETTKLAKLTLQDTSPCPEQEDLDCEECGGQKYDNEEGTYRCLGVRNPSFPYPLTCVLSMSQAEEDGFKWKDCFCLGESTRKVFPYEPQSPTPEEIAAEYERLGFAKESSSRT